MSRNRIVLRDHNNNVLYTRNATNGKTYQFALVCFCAGKTAQKHIRITNVANRIDTIQREYQKYISRNYRAVLLEVVNGEVCLNATQVDYLTGNNDASRETYKTFIPVNPEPARRARRSRTVTEYEVRYIDVHGDAMDVENFSTAKDAIAEAKDSAGYWRGPFPGDEYMAIVVERVDNIISAEDRLLDKKHTTIYTCGDLSALWAWGHVGPHVEAPAIA